MRKMRRNSIDDIFDQMQNLYNEFQDMSRDVAGDMTGTTRGVPIDMHREDGKLIVKADLPGVEKEDINLRSDKNKLEISAQSTSEVKEENEKYFRRERSSRSFRRNVRWPAEIDPETVEANYEEGVLTVTAELAEKSGRSIDVE